MGHGAHESRFTGSLQGSTRVAAAECHRPGARISSSASPDRPCPRDRGWRRPVGDRSNRTHSSPRRRPSRRLWLFSWGWGFLGARCSSRCGRNLRATSRPSSRRQRPRRRQSQNRRRPLLCPRSPFPQLRNLPSPSDLSSRLARRTVSLKRVAILSRASAELRSGRPAAALAALADHQKRFPSGVLAEERTGARIQALCALGRTTEAKAELARLARTSPSSPYESRAREGVWIHPDRRRIGRLESRGRRLTSRAAGFLVRHAAAAAVVLAFMASACERDPDLMIGKFTCPVPDAGALTSVAVPWTAGFEGGFCDYERTGGFCFGDPDATYKIVDTPTHNGRHAAAFTVTSDHAKNGAQARCVLQGRAAGLCNVWRVAVPADARADHGQLEPRAFSRRGPPMTGMACGTCRSDTAADGSLFLYVLDVLDGGDTAGAQSDTTGSHRTVVSRRIPPDPGEGCHGKGRALPRRRAPHGARGHCYQTTALSPSGMWATSRRP